MNTALNLRQEAIVLFERIPIWMTSTELLATRETPRSSDAIAGTVRRFLKHRQAMALLALDQRYD